MSKVGEKSDTRFVISLEELTKKLREPFFSGNAVIEHLKRLSGKVLTIIDSSIVDKQQNKAMKDLIRNEFVDLMSHVTDLVSNGRVLEVTDEEAKNAIGMDSEDILN